MTTLGSHRTGPGTPLGVPRWIWPPALLGVLLVGLPLVALTLRVNWTQLPTLLTAPGSLAALALSLRTAAISTLLCLLLGIPLAVVLARTTLPGRSVLRTLILLPLVLPPVVGGLALLQAFGRAGLLGDTLEVLGLRIAYTTTAVVLAQVFVSLPFLVLSTEGALRSAEMGYEGVAAGLGAAPGFVLTRITLPLVLPGLISGAVLSFARALGEFGATLTFAGSLPGVTRTLPLEIYLQREIDPDAAIALSLLLIAVAVVIVALTHRPAGRR